MQINNETIILDRIERILIWFSRIATIGVLLLAFGVSVYQGISSGSQSELISSIVVGVIVDLLIILIVTATDIGFSILDKSTSWLANQLRKYPKIRRWILIPLGLILMIGTFIVTIANWRVWDYLLIVAVFIVGGVVLPSAIISIIRDETARERTRLIKQIPPDLVIQNPQAAVEHAFTHFEDYLRKRLGVGPDLFSKRLVDYAFAKNGKLIFSEIETENEGVRNFVAGAYATFRNPRKHRIIQDDERTTFAIISVIELLFMIVDESKDREEPVN